MSFQQLIARWLAAKAMQGLQDGLQESVKQAAQEELFRQFDADGGIKQPSTKQNDASEHLGCDAFSDRSLVQQSGKKKTVATETEIGFVFAMSMEAAGITDRLKEKKTLKAGGRIFYTGRLGRFRVAVVESGVGQQKAGQATEILIETFRPQRIVSAGYGGGLSKRLKRFTVCFPEIVRRESDGAVFDLSEPIPRQLPKADGPILDKLGLLTTNFIVGMPNQKTGLNDATGCEIVDMETFSVAEVCRIRRVPFLAVRIILDTATEQLPKDVRNILKSAEKGGVRLAGSVLGSLFKRPAALLDLYSLKEQALQATDRLAKRITKELDEEVLDDKA